MIENIILAEFCGIFSNFMQILCQKLAKMVILKQKCLKWSLNLLIWLVFNDFQLNRPFLGIQC